MRRLADENSEELYLLLRKRLVEFYQKTGLSMPAGRQPSREPKGPNMDVHLADFLCFIHKYADRLQLEWLTYATKSDLILKIEGRPPGNSSRHEMFLFKLRTQTFHYGVFKETIKSFRTIFDLPDDKEFFQCRSQL